MDKNTKNEQAIQEELVKLEEKFDKLHDFLMKVCEDYAQKLEKIENIVKN